MECHECYVMKAKKINMTWRLVNAEKGTLTYCFECPSCTARRSQTESPDGAKIFRGQYAPPKKVNPFALNHLQPAPFESDTDDDGDPAKREEYFSEREYIPF